MVSQAWSCRHANVRGVHLQQRLCNLDTSQPTQGQSCMARLDTGDPPWWHTWNQHMEMSHSNTVWQVFSPQNGGLIIWPPSVRPYVRTYLRTYVRGQRFLRSVWVNWFETLGQEQVRSEDYARQIDFWYHSKWRPGGHLGCKQTWSRNSNNTNWISFKLGAKRTLGMANMYAHLFSVWFQKWRHGGHICFFTPMITLFWLIIYLENCAR